MIWPYGAFNKIGTKIENEHGMPVTFTLEDGLGSLDHLDAVPRYLVKDDPDLATFVSDIRSMTKHEPIRVIQVDLDYIYDPDPQQEDKNLGSLIDRIYTMGINTVFLQAFADPEGTGLARQVYFPNRHLPVRADLLNRVTWQIKQRTHAHVFGWLPVLSYDLGKDTAVVLAFDPKTGTASLDEKNYRRVSIFDPNARAAVRDIFEDMARMAPVDGLLFHDDALLSDFEDAGPEALSAYQKAGLPASIAAIRADPHSMSQWTDFKTESLIDYTRELAKTAGDYRAPFQTARNIYAPVVLTPESKEWFSQDFDRFLASYDYTAVMAMPRMENVADQNSDDWLTRLVAEAAKRPDGLKRTVFELQSVDWRKDPASDDRPIPAKVLGSQMRLLARNGALNFGYYPDDFVKNQPNADELHLDFSLQSYPYRP